MADGRRWGIVSTIALAVAAAACVLVPVAPAAAAPPGDVLHDGPTVIGGTVYPEDVEVGGDGALWSVDRTATIRRFSLADQSSTFTVPSGAGANHIAAAPNGDLWFTTDVSVGRVTTAGVVTELPVETELGAEPGDIVVAPDGTAWWTMRNGPHLGHTTAAGVSTLVPLPVQSTSQVISAEADGTIWSLTYGGGYVIRTTPAGTSTAAQLGGSNIVAGWSHGVVLAQTDGAHIVNDDLTLGPVFSPDLAYSYAGTIKVGADDRLWSNGGAGTIAVDEHGVAQDFGGVGSPVPLPDGSVVAMSFPTETTQRIVRLHDFDEVPIVRLRVPAGLLFQGDTVPVRGIASGPTQPEGGSMGFHASICCIHPDDGETQEMPFTDIAVRLDADGVGDASFTLPPDPPPFAFFSATADYDAPNGQQGNVSLGEYREIAAPTPELRFVSDAYVVFLHRTIERGSIRDQWVAQLRGGRTRAAIAAGLAGSEERRTVLVGELYQRLLHRPADPGGAAAFTGLLRGGASVQHVEAMLAGSGEYFGLHGSTNQAFVAAAYEDLLGRPADPGGAAFWTGRLAAGLGRDALAAGFLGSPEGRQLLVRQAYADALGRAPDPGGLAFWAEQVRRGMHVETLLVALAASDEFFARSQHPHL